MLKGINSCTHKHANPWQIVQILIERAYWFEGRGTKSMEILLT